MYSYVRAHNADLSLFKILTRARFGRTSLVHQPRLPVDTSTAIETLECLQICNLLFERGFLSHDCVQSMKCQRNTEN